MTADDNITIITCWYKIYSNGDIEFNHISNGYDASVITPISVNEFQKNSWKGAKWIGKRATIINGEIIEK